MRRASSRSAARSSVEIIRRIGSPTYVACRSGVSGKLVATWRVIRAPSLLAMPGSALPSWTTSGTLPACARRGRPAPTRSRRSRRPRRAGSGRRTSSAALTAPRSRPGTRSEVGVRPPRQRDRRDQLERVAGLGHDPGLESARGAEAGDLDAGSRAGAGRRRWRAAGRCGRPSRRPASRTRIGVRLAVTCSEVTPLLRTAARRRAPQRGLGARLGAREADQQPERDQRRHQRRPAVGDQRQRDADDREQRQDHAHVDHHLRR